MSDNRVQLPMMCVCDDEGKAEAATAREEARKIAYDTDDYMFTSSVIMALWHEYRVEITGIYCDMWFGIVARRHDISINIACDRVEDGLAAILCYVANTHPKED